jgi:hypothetical protein
MLTPCFVPRDDDIVRLRGAIIDFRTDALRRLVARHQIDPAIIADLAAADTALEALGHWAWEGKDEHHAFALADRFDPGSPIARTRCDLVVERARMVGLMLMDGADPERLARFGAIGSALTAINAIDPAFAEQFV